VRTNPPSQAQQRAAWNFFRDVFLQRSLPYIVNRSGAEDRKLAYVTASERWRIMPREERAMWFYHAMLDPPQSAIPLAEQFTEEPQNDEDQEDEYANAKVRSFMLTFNGDWLQSHRCLQQWLDIGVSDEELCLNIGALPEVDDLFDRFHQHMTNLAKALGLREVSSALEVILSARRRGRIHLHTFMSNHSGNSRVRMKFLIDMVVFDGWRPHVSYTVCAGGATGRSTKSMNARINEGHYYLQFAKYGSLRRDTNWRKHKDFPVQKKWIFNRYKVRQMSDEVAEEELVDARDGVRSAVEELRAIKRFMIERALRARVEESLISHGQNFQQFIPMTEKMVEWRSQYQHVHDRSQTRFNVLVLDGPSRTGKTSWARSMFGARRTW
jgi:hypothetical protein